MNDDNNSNVSINIHLAEYKSTDNNTNQTQQQQQPIVQERDEEEPIKKENKILKLLKKCFNTIIIKSCWPIQNRQFNKIILFILISVLAWLLTYITFGAQALPGGIYFSLAILLSCSHALGFLSEKIKIPSLFAMLLVGIFFKNVPVLSIVGKSIDSKTSSFLRSISFNFILCRAGLSLDLKIINQLKWKIIKFSFMPCLTEALIFGIVSKFVLNIPFLWSFLLGFVVAGVSPAVVVPIMIQCQDSGLGINKKIPSLVISASCIDNIIAITGHSLLISIIFNTGEIWFTIVSCILQVLLGISYGIVIGLLLNIVRVEHAVNIINFVIKLLKLFYLI